jgi:hypothetical protein
MMFSPRNYTLSSAEQYEKNHKDALDKCTKLFSKRTKRLKQYSGGMNQWLIIVFNMPIVRIQYKI